MRSPFRYAFRYTVIAACATIVATGCHLPREALGGRDPTSAAPARYCTGDTITASFDFLQFTPTGACDPSAGSCTAFQPFTRISSTPSLFTPAEGNAYANTVSFPASGDRIEVLFEFGDPAQPDPISVLVPGAPIMDGVRDRTRVLTRVIAPLVTRLDHAGRCPTGFAVPQYDPVDVPTRPDRSPNLQLAQICNPNSDGVHIHVDNPTAGGMNFDRDLMPGDCVGTGEPGVPGFVGNARRIVTTPMTLRCGPGGDGSTEPQPSPPPLRTEIHQACP